jgi:hypothetical protein
LSNQAIGGVKSHHLIQRLTKRLGVNPSSLLATHNHMPTSISQYRLRLKELHPDCNGGDHSKVEELQSLISAHKEHNTSCMCGCGRYILPCHIRRGKKQRYFSRQCARIHRDKLKPKKLKSPNHESNNSSRSVDETSCELG